MHHQPQSPLRLGHLDVDIFRVWDVPEPSSSDVFVVAKYDPWWRRACRRAPRRRARARGALRRAPAFPGARPAGARDRRGVRGRGRDPRLLGKIKVPLAALETNQRYFKVVDLGSIDAAGAIAAGGKLDVALTYGRDADDADSSFDLLKQYLAADVFGQVVPQPHSRAGAGEGGGDTKSWSFTRCASRRRRRCATPWARDA